MSAPVKRTVLSVAAAMLMGALSTFIAITVARLFREHHNGSVAKDPKPPASAQLSD